MLQPQDNAKLSMWQETALRITWSGWPQPWKVEDEVIVEMEPPLNLAANKAHPLHAMLTAARAALRDYAKEHPC